MAELVRLRERAPDLDAEGVRVVVISTEDDAASKAGAARFELPFPVVGDDEGALLDRLGLRHEDGGRQGDVFFSASYLIDDAGVVRFALTPDNWRRRADPDEVLAAARAARGS